MADDDRPTAPKPAGGWAAYIRDAIASAAEPLDERIKLVEALAERCAKLEERLAALERSLPQTTGEAISACIREYDGECVEPLAERIKAMGDRIAKMPEVCADILELGLAQPRAAITALRKDLAKVETIVTK